MVSPLNAASSAKLNPTTEFCGVRNALVPVGKKAAFSGSNASLPASQISPALTPMLVMFKLPAVSNSSYSIGSSLPMNKSLLGTTIEANVK